MPRRNNDNGSNDNPDPIDRPDFEPDGVAEVLASYDTPTKLNALADALSSDFDRTVTSIFMLTPGQRRQLAQFTVDDHNKIVQAVRTAAGNGYPLALDVVNRSNAGARFEGNADWEINVDFIVHLHLKGSCHW